MSYFNVFSIGLFCPIKFAHIEMSDKKQNRLSFGQIVCLLDEGLSQSNIAKQYGVKRQTIGYIAKYPDKIKDALDIVV